MRRILSLVLGLGALMAVTGEGRAAATADEAAKLKAAFESWLPSGVPLTPAEGEYLVSNLSAVQPIGAWTVEPEGTGYRIESPGIRGVLFRAIEPITGRILLTCDPDRMRAEPVAAGRYALSGDEPLSCRLEQAGGGTWRIVARQRRTTGSVDLNAPVALTMEVALDQVTIQRDGDPAPLRIDRLTLSGGSNATPDGRSDLTSRITLEGLSGPSPSGTGMVRADSLAYDVGIQGGDMVGMTNAAVALAKHFAGREGSTGSGDDPAVQALQDAYLRGTGTGSHMAVTLDGIVAATPSVTLKAGTLAFGMGVGDVSREASTMIVRLDGKGLAVEPRSAYSDWTPVEGTVQLSVDDMPLRSILTQMMRPGAGETADPQRLIEARTSIRFNTVRLMAPQAGLDLGGQITMNPDARLQQTGTLQLRLTGIDGLVKALQADPQASQAAAGLSILQVLGRQTALPDGRSARDYDIVIDPSGKVLVNGADVQALVPKPL